jgi:hypothetical protein
VASLVDYAESGTIQLVEQAEEPHQPLVEWAEERGRIETPPMVEQAERRAVSMIAPPGA